MKLFALFCMISVCVISCREEDKALAAKEGPDSLVGGWLYTERGYSPGGGYITEPVAVTPPQIIRFFPDLTVESNIADLTEFKYYKVWQDASAETVMLALFVDKPDGGVPATAKVLNTYFITWEGKTLKLHLRGCIEGCHMGFERLSFKGSSE